MEEKDCRTCQHGWVKYEYNYIGWCSLMGFNVEDFEPCNHWTHGAEVRPPDWLSYWRYKGEDNE